MPGSNRSPIAVDTSVLLNFLKAGRLDILHACTARLVIPTEVRGEVRRPDQVAALDAALADGCIIEEPITATAEVALFAQLAARGALGIGERAVIAIAATRGWGAALQDKPAREEAQRRRITPEQGRQFGLDQRTLTRLIGGAAIEAHARDLGLAIPDSTIADQIQSSSLVTAKSAYTRASSVTVIETVGNPQPSFAVT